MPYDDELGVVLDKLSREDLQEFATKVLRLQADKIGHLTDAELRLKSSERLRKAGGHTLGNIRRKDDHDLPYGEIVKDVAHHSKVKFDKDDDVLMIERKLIDEFFRKAWDESNDEEKEKFFEEVKRQFRERGCSFAEKFTRESLRKMINKGITSEAVYSILGISSSFQTIGWLLGYNVFQKFFLAAIFRYLGIRAAVTAAIAGTGVGGLALRIGGAAQPIILGATTAYLLYKLGGPAFRITAPAVLWIAAKRLELSGDSILPKGE
jgi:uncharacterized protein YaaW (UPF0174 family)